MAKAIGISGICFRAHDPKTLSNRPRGVAIQLRRFNRTDTGAILQLFRQTVHSVNNADYSTRQLAAWAPARLNATTWARRLAGNFTVVALAQSGKGTLVGFAELAPPFVVHTSVVHTGVVHTGVVHTLFVDQHFQRRGVASALLGALEAEATRRGAAKLTTQASLTARPMFEARGFQVVRRQVVVVRGQGLVNFAMTKCFDRAITCNSWANRGA
ncbi:MAG: GNAT family N-acetyltransferase [Alphaproteobacteria bacterium]